MKITKLEYQKSNPRRVGVYVDGNFAAGISQDDVLTLGLYQDKEVTPEELNKIIAQSELGKMFDFAVNFLSFRPRSEWEVRTHLRRRFKENFLAGQNKVIEKLKERGLIDDAAFARWFVEQRNTFRPKGDRVLKQELRSKGVSEEVIKKTLADDGISEFEKAQRLTRKPMDREKIIRHLAARGFGWDTIEEVLANLKNKE